MADRTKSDDKSIELKDDQVIFRFSGVHRDAELVIEFQRTYRALDDEHDWYDNRGRFPLYRVDDYMDSVPAAWNEHGGVFMPMYQSEAMRINLQCEFPTGDYCEGPLYRYHYPMAVKLGAGTANALTGEEWAEELNDNHQDYAVTPYEPSFDGICVGKGVIRLFEKSVIQQVVPMPLGKGYEEWAEELNDNHQDYAVTPYEPSFDGICVGKGVIHQFVKGVIQQFVPMPLGKGYTAQEQLTGAAERRTLQVAVYPMKRSKYEENGPDRPDAPVPRVPTPEETATLELPPGDLNQRSIYEDQHGIDAWDTSVCARLCVHVVNSVDFLKITGCKPPGKPWKREDYEMYEVPWEYRYGGDLKALYAARRFAARDSVKLKKGEGFLPDNDPVTPKVVRKLGGTMGREGVF